MKPSIFKTLFIAGLTLSPSLLMAQSPSATSPSATTPSATSPSGGAQSGSAGQSSAGSSNVSQSAQEQFGTLDSDRNGRLSQEEFARFSPVTPNPARDASSSTGAGRNGTGPGNPGSTTGTTGGITGSANDADRDPRMNMTPQERFRQLDANSDGQLSQEEFARANPTNVDAGRDASSSTNAGRNGLGGGTPGSTTGSTEGSTGNPGGKEDTR